MKTLTLVILETDPDYGSRLARYIAGRDDSPFLVRLFLQHPCPPDDLLQADAVMADASLWPRYRELPRSCPVLVLTEDGLQADGADASAYKYCSASILLEAMQRCFLDHSGRSLPPDSFAAHGFRITALYTPSCGPEISEAVLARVREAASAAPALYLNMEQVPSRGLFLEEPGEGLSALIYYLKQYRENLGSRITLMIRNSGFDYLLPAQYPGELGELSAADWRQLAQALRTDTSYEQVFLDFGAALPAAGALPCCDEILILRGDTSWEEEMTVRFSRLVTHAGGDEAGSRIRILSRR